MARTATQEPEVSENGLLNSQENEAPDTIVGYNANGETVAMPVDRTPEQPLPGFEDEAADDAEMFEGKRILGHKWSLSGNQMVNTRNVAMLDKLNVFREGKAALLLIQVEPGSVTMEESTEDGHVRGVFHKRKLHITDVFVADAIDTDALFEGGLIRVRKSEPDDVGYLTTDPNPIPDSDNPLADSLAEAMPLEAGMCGEIHEGHLNQCRQPRHSCPLRTA